MASEDVQTFTPKQYSIKIVYQSFIKDHLLTSSISLSSHKCFILNHLKV